MNPVRNSRKSAIDEFTGEALRRKIRYNLVINF